MTLFYCIFTARRIVGLHWPKWIVRSMTFYSVHIHVEQRFILLCIGFNLMLHFYEIEVSIQVLCKRCYRHSRENKQTKIKESKEKDFVSNINICCLHWFVLTQHEIMQTLLRSEAPFNYQDILKIHCREKEEADQDSWAAIKWGIISQNPPFLATKNARSLSLRYTDFV